MKKILFITAVACLSFAACDDLENGGGTGEISDNPILSDKPTTPLQPSEQKTKLESAAVNFMNECPAEDFEKISGIVEAFCNDIDTKEYNLSSLENWYFEQIENSFNEEDKVVTSNGKVEIKSTVDILVLLANHNGHFIFGDNGTVTVDESYNGLKATYTLNGKNYEAVIKQSGKVTEAIYTSSDKTSWEEDYGYWNPEKGEYVYLESPAQINDQWNFKLKVGVPERLDISIKENGSPLAEVVAKFTPSFTAGGIVPSKDSFSTEVTVKIEDYEYIIENLKYNGATGKASNTQTLKKNGKTLVYQNVSGDVRIEQKTINDTWEGGYEEYQYIEVSLAKNITASLDILGEVQVIGACSDAMEASDELEAFWDALPDEETAKRHLNNFNAKFDFGVFYDKGNNRQADLEFEYRHNLGEYDSYYEFFPVIVFNDGSRYSVEEYFTEDAFGNLIEDFYDFCDSFSEVFGFIFDYDESALL